MCQSVVSLHESVDTILWRRSLADWRICPIEISGQCIDLTIGQLDLAIVEVGADLAGGIDFVLGGVALLGLLGLAGEEHKALLVLLQTLDIGLERLLGQVLSAWVDGNADSGRQLAWDASLLSSMHVRDCPALHPHRIFSYLQLGERETTTGAHAAVVLESRAADHRPQSVDWTWCHLGSLLLYLDLLLLHLLFPLFLLDSLLE